MMWLNYIKKHRRSMGVCLGLALWLAGIAVAPAVLGQGFQEESLPQITTLGEIENALTRLESVFQEKSLDDVLTAVDTLRTQLQPHLKAADPTFETVTRLRKVQDRLDMITGVREFGAGHQSSSRDAFKRLFQRTPDFVLDGNIATPEMAQFFERLREQSVGYLTINGIPLESEVFLQDRLLGKIPLYAVYMLAGQAEITVRHEGYDDHTETLDIVAGKETAINVSLTKNSGRCLVTTSPPGVDIYLDGDLKGRTSGLLPDQYHENAIEQGVDPATVSSPLIIDFIPLGEHIIEFAKPCFSRLKYRIDVTLGEFYIPPVQLHESYANVTIQSFPANSEVLIEGRSLGQTPLEKAEVCPGVQEVRIELNTPSNWFGQVDIREEALTSIHAVPRPTFMFLGCTGPDMSLAKSLTDLFDQWISTGNWFNTIDPSALDRIRIRPVVARTLELLSRNAGELSREEWLDILGTLAISLGDTDAKLFGAAFVEQTADGYHLTLILTHYRNSRPDIIPIRIKTLESTVPQAVQAVFETRYPAAERWLGLNVIEDPAGLLITEIDNNGPAVSTTLEPGAILTQVNDLPVKHLADLVAIVQNPETGSLMKISGRQGESRFEYELQVPWHPVMLPFDLHELPYNLALAELEEYSAIPELQAAADFNAGICYMALGRPDIALEGPLSKVVFQHGFGVSQGTLLYVRARCARSAGYHDAARQYLKEAESYPDATFFNPNGPHVLPLVRLGIE